MFYGSFYLIFVIVYIRLILIRFTEPLKLLTYPWSDANSFRNKNSVSISVNCMHHHWLLFLALLGLFRASFNVTQTHAVAPLFASKTHIFVSAIKKSTALPIERMLQCGNFFYLHVNTTCIVYNIHGILFGISPGWHAYLCHTCTSSILEFDVHTTCVNLRLLTRQF